MSLAVEATGLVKVFGKTRAVDGLDLRVPAGSVYGVLGPNGAGKTTTIRMLATLTRPDRGTARVLGHDTVGDPVSVRARISLAGQSAPAARGAACRRRGPARPDRVRDRTAGARPAVRRDRVGQRWA